MRRLSSFILWPQLKTACASTIAIAGCRTQFHDQHRGEDGSMTGLLPILSLLPLCAGLAFAELWGWSRVGIRVIAPAGSHMALPYCGVAADRTRGFLDADRVMEVPGPAPRFRVAGSGSRGP